MVVNVDAAVLFELAVAVVLPFVTVVILVVFVVVVVMIVAGGGDATAVVAVVILLFTAGETRSAALRCTCFLG